MNRKEISEALVGRRPLPPLSPSGVWRVDLGKHIEVLDCGELLKAGLHLWNDELSLSHEIAQKNENRDGNYLHAILHRREGDFENSRYWLQRIKHHPVWEKMTVRFPEWTAEAFVEWCRDRKKPQEELLEFQALEMRYLLDHLT